MIGVWRCNQDPPEPIPELAKWAEEKGATSVIWTALPPKYREVNGTIPSIEEALEFLQSLDAGQKQRAEEYIRKAPEQVRTPYRHEFEINLGWYPL